MCNLYSITTNQAAIAALFRVVNRYVGNLAPMPGVFPDYPAPVVRNTERRTRADHDALGHAAAAEVDVAASYEYPQHVVVPKSITVQDNVTATRSACLDRPHYPNAHRAPPFALFATARQGRRVDNGARTTHPTC